MSKKRERELARREQGKQEPRRGHKAADRKRRMTIGVVTALAVGIAVAAWLIASSPANPDEANHTPLPSSQSGHWSTPPPTSDAVEQDWTAVLTTSVGDIELSLDGVKAPQAVASFNFLASEAFFDGTGCHRLLPDSLLQCGDPTATGTGGPGYNFGPIENAPTNDVYPAGTVAMARVGGDGESMGSQFFLVFNDVTLPADAAGGYTVIGTVTSGLDLLMGVGQAGTVDGSMDGSPLTRVIIESVEVT